MVLYSIILLLHFYRAKQPLELSSVFVAHFSLTFHEMKHTFYHAT